MKKKKIKWIVVSIILILLACIVLSDTYIGRYIRWNVPDVYDLNKFPSTTIECGNNKFKFSKSNNEIIHRLRFDIDNRQIDLNELVKKTKTNSLLIIHNDTLIYENYLNGNSEKTLFKVFSATKSILSVLIGIAVDEGYIKSVNDSIGDYISDLKDDLKKISIQECLNQTTGIKYKGSYAPWADEPRWYYYKDVRRLTKQVKIDSAKYKSWENVEYNVLLLGMILENSTNQTISGYLQNKIWIPIGMEYPASFSIDSKKHKFEKVGDGLNMTAIDFAKIGRLFLNNGEWNGKEIISSQWIKESTSNDNSIKTDRDGVSYKDLWWIKNNDYYAEGHFGQYLYISPSSNTVIVRFGKAKGGVSWWNEIFPKIIEGLK